MKQLLTGNEAIARGFFEACGKFASGYPGTPSTEIMENIAKYDSIYSEWAPNEKVAVESAIGAAFAGSRSIAIMKHVGLNVAADPLFTCSYTGINAGMIIVSADDPGIHSSQNEQDNRHYAKSSKIPMLEPSDSQEAKDFVKIAFYISEYFDTPVLLRLTTRVCHSKSLVEFEHASNISFRDIIKSPKFDPIPKNSRVLHAHVEERLKSIEELSNAIDINTVEFNKNSTIGIITSGICYQYAKEVFSDTVSYMKLGLSYPLPMDKIKNFSEHVDTLYVIEELDSFMEEQIKAYGINCIGKEKLPILYELNPTIIRHALLNDNSTSYSNHIYDDKASKKLTFCAGCPYRGFFYELSKLDDIIISSDIGCYSLSSSEPFYAKDIAICMGASFSLAHGIQQVLDMRNINKKCIGIMGDSTFFHSGMTSLLNAVYNHSNVLLVILDNRTTSMTGFQENPGTGKNIHNEETYLVKIEDIVPALGVKNLKIINPLNLLEVNDALNWGLSLTSPSVIIARSPCALKKVHSNSNIIPNYINRDKCIKCKKCLEIDCPALSYNESKNELSINSNICVGCNVCSQLCPTMAIIKEDDYHG